MLLEQRVKAFCKNEDLFGDRRITDELVANAWQQMHLKGINVNTYYTERWLAAHDQIELPKTWPIYDGELDHAIFLEYPTEGLIKTIFREQGLEPKNFDQESVGPIIEKLRRALIIIEKVPAIAYDVKRFVRSIIALHVDDMEIDVSYSHPNIPFSIFVSVSEDDSEISDIRMAESIIHEAMHLKLTLIEKAVPLVNTGSQKLYFSPWRDELRHPRGVLHGIFVFRVIHNFYSELHIKALHHSYETFVDFRLAQINGELSELTEFENCPDLTPNGASLTANLLPLN